MTDDTKTKYIIQTEVGLTSQSKYPQLLFVGLSQATLQQREVLQIRVNVDV